MMALIIVLQCNFREYLLNSNNSSVIWNSKRVPKGLYFFLLLRSKSLWMLYPGSTHRALGKFISVSGNVHASLFCTHIAFHSMEDRGGSHKTLMCKLSSVDTPDTVDWNVCLSWHSVELVLTKSPDCTCFFKLRLLRWRDCIILDKTVIWQ